MLNKTCANESGIELCRELAQGDVMIMNREPLAADAATEEVILTDP